MGLGAALLLSFVKDAKALQLSFASASSAGAESDKQTNVVRPAKEDSHAGVELPDALPPLDAEMLDLLDADLKSEDCSAEWQGVKVFAQGGVRLDFFEDNDARSEMAWLYSGYGSVGVLWPLALTGKSSGTLRVEVGEGGTFGRTPRHRPQRFELPPFAASLWVSNVELLLPLLGAEHKLRLQVGRMRHELGDGRWLGKVPFDPRGATFDGIFVAQDLSFWSGGHALKFEAALFSNASPLFLDVLNQFNVLADAALHFNSETVDFELYGFFQRDFFQEMFFQQNAGRRTGENIQSDGGRTHMGTRLFYQPALGDFWGLKLKAGADVQSLFALENAFLEHIGVHVEFEGRLELALRKIFSGGGTPYFGVSAEATPGFSQDVDASSKVFFLSPAPDVHGFLGQMDVVTADNIAATQVLLGWKMDSNLRIEASLWALSAINPSQGVWSPNVTGFRPISLVSSMNSNEGPVWLFNEADLRIEFKLLENVFFEVQASALFASPFFAELPRQIPRLRIGAALVWETTQGDGRNSPQKLSSVRRLF